MTHETREQWAQGFLAAARPAFASVGATLPASIRIGVGWTNKGARGKAIGECWTKDASADGTVEIILSPKLADGSRVADVLTHELIHAGVGLACGHKGAFTRAAKALGLEGKMTATVAGEAWRAWAEPILATLGPYPHATLDGVISSGPKKQATRQLKFECGACGIIGRMPRKSLERGIPFCGACGDRMTCAAIDSDEGEGSEDQREAA